MAPAHRRTRRALALLSAGLLTALVLVVLAAEADATDGYRYWNYFHVSNGAYVFAQTGPGSYKPKDGAVEAYRYGLSTAADGIKPRTAATTYGIDDICGTTKPAAGQKRVGVLIDYGTSADSGSRDTLPEPRAACAVVPAAATGQQVLEKVAKVRVEKQLTCGIDGYPATGCSVTIKNARTKATEKSVAFAMPAKARTKQAAGSGSKADSSGGLSLPVVGVGVAVVVLAAGALLLSRRNRDA
jgi:hypothetical protein